MAGMVVGGGGGKMGGRGRNTKGLAFKQGAVFLDDPEGSKQASDLIFVLQVESQGLVTDVISQSGFIGLAGNNFPQAWKQRDYQHLFLVFLFPEVLSHAFICLHCLVGRWCK